MMTIKRNQQGFSLFMVMIMMIVIAFLVVVTSQSTSTESRLSANEADRKYALTEAELGLRDAENLLNKIYDELTRTKTSSGTGSKLMVFKPDCTGSFNSGITKDVGGLCTAMEFPRTEYEKNVRSQDRNQFVDVQGTANKAAHDRDVFSNDARNLKSANGKSIYVIEYLGQRTNETGTSVLDYFRVTSRANGQNENTQVMLQSYVEMARSIH